MVESDSTRRHFIREAVELARRSVERGGGPFGAVIVRDGVIIGRGHNSVVLCNDPTAHAEIEAIRQACSRSSDFHLDGCELYVSCMPCPMCLGAAYWAHISRIFYAASSEEADAAGFQDGFIARELTLPVEQRSLSLRQIADPRGSEVLGNWQRRKGRVEY